MPRGRQKRPVLEPIRRKCEDTGTVKQVNYRHFTIPPVNTNMGTKSPTYNPNTPNKNREDIEKEYLYGNKILSKRYKGEE